MSIFELLSNFLEPFLELIPRLARRPAGNEWMVVDSIFGVREGNLPVLYVPSLTHIEYFPSCSLPIDCGLQRATTADNMPVAINATAVVRITDPVLCRSEVGGSYEEAASMAIRHVVCEMVMGHNFSHVTELCMDGSGEEEMAVALEEIGIELAAFRIEDLQQIIPISVLN